MPCWEVRQVTLNLGTLDASLVAAAMESLGLKITNGAKGVLILTDARGAMGTFAPTGALVHDAGLATNRGPLSENLVRQAYTGQVVKAAAARFGWKVTTAGPQKIQLGKR